MEDRAVLDRIEDGKWAVLLVGEEKAEKIIPIETLPEGAKEGSWLRVQLEDDEVKEILVDAEETEKVRKRVEAAVRGLRKRKRRLKPVHADVKPAEPPAPTSIQPVRPEEGEPDPDVISAPPIVPESGEPGPDSIDEGNVDFEGL